MAERLYFRLPEGARKYFLVDSRSGLETMFDAYYLCALNGIVKLQLGEDDRIEKDYFTDGYPGVYRSRRELIAGCLVDAEMRRRGVQKGDRVSIQSLVLELTSNNDTLLSEKGIERLNLYAAGGFEGIRGSIVQTNDLGTFLVHFTKLLSQGSSDDVVAV